MTLTRPLIATAVLVLLLTVGVTWLWQYVYTPQGQARNIIAVLQGRADGVRPWLIRHGLTRPVVFDMPKGGASHLAAAELLANLGSEAAPTILEMLNDPDPRVRQAAAIACGMTRDPSAFDSLVQRLGDSDEFVQAAAATALAGYGPRAITPLLELGKHAGPNLAWSLPLALGKAAGPRAVPLLLQLHASGLGVISGEYDALVECGNDAAFAALSEMVRRYGDPFAIGALGQLRDRRAIPLIRSCLPRPELVSAAVCALSEMQDSASVPDIVKFVQDADKSREEAGRQIAIRALGRAKDRRAVDVLVHELRDGGFWGHAYDAAEALGEIGDPAAVEPLLTMLRGGVADRNPKATAAAAGAWLVLGTPRGALTC